MKLESLVFGIAGACFGLIAGWAIGTQQAQRSPQDVQASVPQAAPAGSSPAIIDQDRVETLRGIAERDPENIEVRVQLGNLYYDGERYDLAIPWYEEALALDTADADVSTDLGVAYYQMNQSDKALEQFAYSLSVDPRHVKTLLNTGIVRAFGKQDLDGAAEAWRQVVELAPGTQEALVAQQALESIAAAHPGIGGQSSSSGSDR